MLYRLSLSCPARSPFRSALRICCTEPVAGSQVCRVWRSSKEAKMRNVWSGKRSLGIFVKFVKSWSFTDEESYLFAYIGNVWHFSNLIPKFLQYIFLVRDRRPRWLMKHYTIFFFRGIWMKKSLVLSGGKRYLFVSTYVAAVMSAENLQWSCDHCSTNACTT